MKNKFNMILLSLFSVLSAFSCNDDKMDIDRKMEEITFNGPEVIRLHVGETGKYSINVPADLKATYTWVYNKEILSESTEVTFSPQASGSGTLTIVIKNENKQYKVIEKEVLVARNEGMKVVGYYPSYRDNFTNMDWSKLTHVNLSFARVRADGSLNDSQVREKFRYIAREAHAHGVYLLLSLGGGGGEEEQNSFSTALLNAEARQNIIKNALQTVKDLSLDGIDVDYEDWGWKDTEMNSRKSEALTSLLAGFRSEMEENALLTVSIYISALTDGWYTKEMIDMLDYATLMTYDKTGSWASSEVGPHAPFDYYTQTVEKCLELGYPKEKIIPGIPFYGRIFPDNRPETSYLITYSEIVDTYPGAENQNAIDGIRLYYDGLPMVKQKTQYAKDNGIGGVMIWEITQDSPNQSKNLLNAINSIVESPQ